MARFAVALLAVLCMQRAHEVSAHGKLTVPRSRNQIDGNGGCAHCLNTGGPCGDGERGKFLDTSFGSQSTWTAGSIVPIEITITAHHMGHYEFRICDQVLNSDVADPDACLNKWVLERATPVEAGFDDCELGDKRAACTPFDPKHPERYYLPPRDEVDLTHTIYFKVPAGLQCEVCTLQWHWWSANSCIPAGDYGCYKDVLVANGYWVGNKSAWWTAGAGGCQGPAGPNGHFGCGEQFWNCADITVQAAGSTPETTMTTTTTAAVATSTTSFSQSTLSTTATTTAAVSTSTTSQSVATCVAAAGAENYFETTDQSCEVACQALPAGQWPCGSGHPCRCSEVTTTIQSSSNSATSTQQVETTTTTTAAVLTTTVQSSSNSATSTQQVETTTTTTVAVLTHCVPNEDLPIFVGKPTAEACLACPERTWDPCNGRTVDGQFYDLCICPESLAQTQATSKAETSLKSEVRKHNFLSPGTQKDHGSVFIQSGTLASKASEAAIDEL